MNLPFLSKKPAEFHRDIFTIEWEGEHPDQGVSKFNREIMDRLGKDGHLVSVDVVRRGVEPRQAKTGVVRICTETWSMVWTVGK